MGLWWSGDVTAQQRQNARNREEREESIQHILWLRKKKEAIFLGWDKPSLMHDRSSDSFMLL